MAAVKPYQIAGFATVCKVLFTLYVNTYRLIFFNYKYLGRGTEGVLKKMLCMLRNSCGRRLIVHGDTDWRHLICQGRVSALRGIIRHHRRKKRRSHVKKLCSCQGARKDDHGTLLDRLICCYFNGRFAQGRSWGRGSIVAWRELGAAAS